MGRRSGPGGSLVPITWDVQSLVDREQGKFEASRDADFVEDVRQVVFDGFFAYVKPFGDLLVSGGIDDQGYDLQLPIGQIEVARRWLLLRKAGDEVLQGGNNVRHSLPADPVTS